MKIKEARALSNKKIKAEIESKIKELEALVFDFNTGKERNVRAVKNLKKDIAVLKTVQREKELIGEFDK